MTNKKLQMTFFEKENQMKDWKKFDPSSLSVGFEPVQKSALTCLSNAWDLSATESDG